MGYAIGSMLPDQVQNLTTNALKHFIQLVESNIEQYIGPDLADFVAKYGLEAALDLTYEFTREYTPQRFYDEMQGLSDASGTDYNTILRLHMFPELVQAACSIFGAWDSATPDGSLLQLRALDWDTNAGLQDYPLVTIYHPNEGDGHPFANVGWVGWVASITGMSSSQVAMSQKVTDYDFGTNSRIGYPFHFLIRDILQYDQDLDAAISRMANARRTCNIWLGCGDGKHNLANLFQYSHSDLVVIDADTVIDYPSNETKYAHPLIQDVVYWGINQPCFSAVLQEQHGNITAENTISHIISMSKTGDVHAAIYDLTHMYLYVANARGVEESGPLNAYQRSFVFFDMKPLFSVQLESRILEMYP